MSFNITTFPVGLYQCNCSVISCKNTGEAVVIDPGSDPEIIIAKIKSQGLSVKYILHTHAHLDHFGATSEVKGHCCDADIVLHKADLELYRAHNIQAAMLQLPDCDISEITHFLEDEEEFVFGDGKIQAVFTPGHTPGSSCFTIETELQPIVFSGDTLFNGGVGRTDLWGGDQGTLVKSIKQRLYSLDDEYKVIPGHGPSTSIQKEKRSNPFVRG